MTEAKSLPLGVPPFRPIKVSDSLLTTKSKNPIPSQNIVKKAAIYQDPRISSNNFVQSHRNTLTSSQKLGNKPKLPAFQALPSSVSRISTGEIIQLDDVDSSNIQKVSQVNFIHSEKNETILFQIMFRSKQMKNALYANQISENTKYVSDSSLPDIDLKGHTVEELAAVANVSVNAIRKAIEMRRKQLMAERESQTQTKVLSEQDFFQIQTHLENLKEKLPKVSAKPIETTVFFTTSAPTTPPPVVTAAEIVTKKNVVKKAVIGGGSKVNILHLTIRFVSMSLVGYELNRRICWNVTRLT